MKSDSVVLITYSLGYWSKKVVVLSAVLFLLLGFLTACSTGNLKSSTLVDNEKQGPELMPSHQTIPKREKNKEGVWLAYVPAADPYSAQKGRVDKTSVETFIQAKRALKAGKIDEAEKHFDRIATTDKKLSGPWVFKGDIALDKKELEEAASHFDKAISINNKNINAYIRLAKVQRMLGDFVKAQNTYVRALSIWPDFPEAHLNLGILYDVYLNDSLQAQRHMEAYQFLTGFSDTTVAKWLEEIQSRTGAEYNLMPEAPNESQNVEGVSENSPS